MMTKHNVSEQVAPPSVESHGLLRGLIEALHHMVISMAYRLRHAQIHHSPMGDPKGKYDIWKKLGSHVEQVSAESKPVEKPRATGKGTTPAPVLASAPEQGEYAPATVLEFNALNAHSKRKAVKRLQPRMNEQLQNATMEHINIALILAREGNADGARLHIDLAESAMHTASRFMSHDDYEAFEHKVEHRLAAIVDEDDADDAMASQTG